MATHSLIDDVIKLIYNGWKPYNNQPEISVYEELQCQKYKKDKPQWFYLHDKYVCISCARKCSRIRPSGFQAPLPINYRTKKRGHFYNRTPLELAQVKHVLNLHEVEYCLNVTYAKVYSWVREGKLVALNEPPLRVRSKEVLEMMLDFDE